MIFIIFLVGYATVSNSEYNGNHGISDQIFKISRSVFRVIPSYLAFRELSEYVFRKNKGFCEKIFFDTGGSVFGQKSDHFGRGFYL